MKKLLTLLFSILISFNSYGEWVKVTESIDSNVFYVETNTIREKNGYVYFWYMTDYLIPSDSGVMSTQSYIQGDCNLKRDKTLAFLYYKKSMGNGESTSYTPPDKWHYSPPSSAFSYVLNYVCD